MAARDRRISDALAMEIKVAATRKGMKAFHLAKATGIAKSTMAEIWNGNTFIDVDQYSKICAALGLDPGTLIQRAQEALAAISPEDDEIIASSSLDDSAKRAMRNELINAQQSDDVADMESLESPIKALQRERSAGS